jgi:ubiquinone/menaquinone biosynthesis C-methylase UbiE
MSEQTMKDAVQRQFGAVAANYTSSAVHRGGPDLDAMLAIAPKDAQRMLDAGCGTGHTALAFAALVPEVIAVDLTELMLEQGRNLAAERGLSNVRFERADVENLPFADASFDLITSRYSAHHYPHPVQALREFRRVLKPGGTLLLLDVVSPEDPTQDTFQNAIELLRDPSHVRDHSVSQWSAMLEEVGFTTELIQTWPLRLEFVSWVTRMQTPTASVEQIQTLLANAPESVRSAFAMTSDTGYDFSFPIALLRGN